LWFRDLFLIVEHIYRTNDGSLRDTLRKPRGLERKKQVGIAIARLSLNCSTEQYIPAGFLSRREPSFVHSIRIFLAERDHLVDNILLLFYSAT